MQKIITSSESVQIIDRRRRKRFRGDSDIPVQGDNNQLSESSNIGSRLRKVRTEHNYSIRSLAQKSGLNANTLSLIENDKTSPSVSTLQQLANALEVPLMTFFETGKPKQPISYQKNKQRKKEKFAHGTLEDLGAGLTLHGGQPFIVTLEPRATSGAAPIVHTGLELVYSLEGQLSYTIDDQVYPLEPGDSLVFEAHMPHWWKNTGDSASRSLLIMCPTDESDRPYDRHFKSSQP